MLKTTFPTIDRESSMLGFGCMRFPCTAEGKIDEAEAIRMVRHAIDSGVTYIDTAYPYHGGESEVVVGKALQDGYRDRVILTTKLPIWKVEKYEDMMTILDEQLAKLQTDHVDFYILHAMNNERMDLMQKLDYKKFFAEALAQGKIRYPGFSFHDDFEAFMRILNDWDQWKMAQVQMNILDDTNQATLEGIRECGKRGIGVVIMEPLRGGLLANPPADVKGVYEEGNYYIADCDAEFGELRTYLLAQLLKDPYIDYEAEMYGYLEAVYGPGGKHIGEFIEIITDHAVTDRKHLGIYQKADTGGVYCRLVCRRSGRVHAFGRAGGSADCAGGRVGTH